MSVFKEVHLLALKGINESHLMVNVAKKSLDSRAMKYYNDRAMEYEAIAIFCKQKDEAKKNGAP